MHATTAHHENSVPSNRRCQRPTKAGASRFMATAARKARANVLVSRE